VLVGGADRGPQLIVVEDVGDVRHRLAAASGDRPGGRRRSLLREVERGDPRAGPAGDVGAGRSDAGAGPDHQHRPVVESEQ